MTSTKPNRDRSTSANHVLHFFHPLEGLNGGAFVHSFLNTYALGDDEDREALHLSFPNYAELFDLFVGATDGPSIVRAVAAELHEGINS